MDSDPANLPPEIQVTSNFCFWKYGESVNGKAPKIPYSHNAMQRKIVKGMGDYKTHLMFSYQHYNTLLSSGEIGQEFSLLDSDLSVIDIDNYCSHPLLDQAISSLFQKGRYIELSPSVEGFHIFYEGASDWSFGRNKGVKSLDDLPTTCEVYSFHDKRFITLTGRCLKDPSNQEENCMPEVDMISEELQILQELFFTAKEKSSLACSDILKALPSYHFVDAPTAQRLAPFLLDLVKWIEDSSEFIRFEQLCLEEKPSKYSSPSEADMAFAGIITRAADLTLPEEDQKQVLHMAFERYRCKRPKLQERLKYLAKTSSTALQNVSTAKPNSKSSNRMLLS